MFRKNKIFIKKIGNAEDLKNAIFGITKNWVFKNNDVKELTNELDKELEIGQVRNLDGGIYPEYISLAKSDYELLNIEDNKIFGMEVILRNE